MLVQPIYFVLSVFSYASLSNEIFCGSFISDQKSCYVCAYHISKTNFIPQLHGQKSCRRQTQCSSTLCGCQCKWPIWCCPLQPFQIRYLVFISEPKYFFCVPTTLAKQILFHSHRNKKLVGGIHNALVHYVNVYTLDPSGIVLCNTSK